MACTAQGSFSVSRRFADKLDPQMADTITYKLRAMDAEQVKQMDDEIKVLSWLVQLESVSVTSSSFFCSGWKLRLAP